METKPCNTHEGILLVKKKIKNTDKRIAKYFRNRPDIVVGHNKEIKLPYDLLPIFAESDNCICAAGQYIGSDKRYYLAVYSIVDQGLLGYDIYMYNKSAICAKNETYLYISDLYISNNDGILNLYKEYED